MAFESSRRHGKYWEDAKLVHELIHKVDFNNTAKTEREYEHILSSSLNFDRQKFSSDVMTQTNNDTTVNSIYCFGKKHRPDMAIGDNVIAIELKYVNYDGLKNAIGQGHIYRLHYKFVFLVLVIGKDRRKIYDDLNEGKEKELEDLLQYLADEMSIFTYVVPTFRLDVGKKKSFAFFEPLNLKD